MNNKIRFLVLDQSNAPQAPSAHGMSLPNVQSDKSPSFTDEATAISFAKALAKKQKGRRFYVAKVLGGAVAYDTLGEEETANVEWTPATAE